MKVNGILKDSYDFGFLKMPQVYQGVSRTKEFRI